MATQPNDMNMEQMGFLDQSPEIGKTGADDETVAAELQALLK